MLYLGFECQVAPGEAVRAIRAACASVVAIDRGSVRVSAQPPAVGFAFDPRTSAAQVVSRLNARLRAAGVRLAVLKLET